MIFDPFPFSTSPLIGPILCAIRTGEGAAVAKTKLAKVRGTQTPTSTPTSSYSPSSNTTNCNSNTSTPSSVPTTPSQGPPTGSPTNSSNNNSNTGAMGGDPLNRSVTLFGVWPNRILALLLIIVHSINWTFSWSLDFPHMALAPLAIILSQFAASGSVASSQFDGAQRRRRHP